MERTTRSGGDALAPVETQPGVLVHPAADRRLAVAHWLLSTLPDHRRKQAKEEWKKHGLAVLPMGTLLSAVRIPARLILAIAGGSRPSGEVDKFLLEALEGGPVICDSDSRRYYALVPASTPQTLSAAVVEWRPEEVECLGRGSYLGVPRLDVTRYDPAHPSYWSVPMPSLATLCSPLAVARLIATGVHMVAEEADADAEA